MSLSIFFVLCVQAKIDVKKHKKSVNAVLLLIYIVHPSGSDIFETSNEKVKTCGMYGPLKNPVHSFIKKSFFFPTAK